MSYTPFTWHDGEAGGTPIVASRLNAIEQGIADAHDVTDALENLSSYVPGIIRSAVVDHNLDVPGDPLANRYIRLESGLQLCWGRDHWISSYHTDVLQVQNTLYNYTEFFKYTPPATLEFVLLFHIRINGWNDTISDISHALRSVNYQELPDGSGDISFSITRIDENLVEWLSANFFVIGRWK